MPSPRAALLLALGLAACDQPPSEGPAPLPQVERPNILLFTLDTVRADALGTYGKKGRGTPNLDSLAEHGVRFERAYTVTPLTIPAHSSLFTGLLPPRHGVQDNGDFFLAEGATTLAELLRDAGYDTMAAVGAEVTSHHWGFAQGFDDYFDDMGAVRGEEKNRWRVERPADQVAADAGAWLERHQDAERPWFAWVHMFDAHAPYEPPPPFDALFEGRPYLGEVCWVDLQVGLMLRRLNERGALDRTWVFVMGDHGEGLGDHGEAMHGVLLYDATTRIPLLVRPPGGRAGGLAVGEPVSLVDVMPTVLSVAGIAGPTDLDGRDLAPLMAGETGPEQARDIYMESLYAFRHYGWAPQRALVKDGFKLIDSTTPELYRLGLEEEDLVGSMGERRDAMRGRVQELVAAMEPQTAASDRAQLSAERMSQLAALGYMTGVVEPAPETAGLPDPVTRLPVLAKLEQARLAFQAGKLDEARALEESILEDEPHLTDSRMLLANIMMAQGDLAGARSLLEALEAESPSSQARAMLGSILLRSGDALAARATLQAALDLDPYLAQAWVPYLHVLISSGDLEALESALGLARENLPDDVAVRSMYGVLLAMKSNFAEAEPVLLGTMAEQPDLPFCHLALAAVRRAQGREEEAESLLEEELRLYGTIGARYQLVEILAGQKRYEEQLEQLMAIAAQEPPSFLTHHSLAQALYNLKRYEQAEAEVDTCLELAPTYPACAMLRANILKRLGRQEEAVAAYRFALQLVGQEDAEGAASSP
ncbi:MAG: sulfatase-like hydrolase/transferase [Pseudomonadota bacterium]